MMIICWAGLRLHRYSDISMLFRCLHLNVFFGIAPQHGVTRRLAKTSDLDQVFDNSTSSLWETEWLRGFKPVLKGSCFAQVPSSIPAQGCILSSVWRGPQWIFIPTNEDENTSAPCASVAWAVVLSSHEQFKTKYLYCAYIFSFKKMHIYLLALFRPHHRYDKV